MDLTEKDIATALGVEMPEDTGAQEQETAAPADTTGENVQEPAAPAEEDVQEETVEEQPPEGQKQEQTRAERARFAAARRKAETEEAVRKAVEEANKANEQKWKEFFAGAGLNDPINDKPITSFADYEAYQSARRDQEMQDRLSRGELTTQDIQEAVKATPEYQEIAAAARRARDAEEAAERTRLDNLVEQEMTEIRKLDPSVESLESILTSERGEAFRKYVERGNSFVDAFYLSHRDEIEARRVAAAAQEAANSIRGKSHLQPVSAKGGSAMVDVPADELALYRQLNPDASLADIKAHYNKQLKR